MPGSKSVHASKRGPSSQVIFDNNWLDSTLAVIEYNAVEVHISID